MGIHAALVALRDASEAPITHLKAINPHVADVLDMARKQGACQISLPELPTMMH